MPLTYKYRDTYAISSHIEDYREIEEPIYQTKGTMMDSTMMVEYSSKDHLISQEEMHSYMKKHGLLLG